MKHLKVEIKNQVQWVALARPEKRNAFHPEMIQELTEVFTNAGKQGERAMVLLGAGESFCAGGDIDWMKSMVEFSDEENRRDSEQLFDMFEAGRNCPIPLLGRVHGHAMGGGLGLLAICDIAAAEAQTSFCFSEVRIGLVPAVISSFVLEKMPAHRARELMLTGRVFNAETAVKAGLIHFQGQMKQVDSFIGETLVTILQAGPEAVKETKKLLRFLSENPRSSYREESTRVIAERRASEEGQAGLKSFLEKNPVPWV